jgi:hypothetical protein
MPMSLLLWTSTSDKPQVKRRFSRSYPQAVTVVVGPQEIPVLPVPAGVQTPRRNTQRRASMLGRV